MDRRGELQVFWHNLQEMFFKERNRWFIWIPVLFGFGIGMYFVLPNEPARWWVLIAIELILVLAYFWRGNPGRLLALLVTFIVIAGFADIQLKTLYFSQNVKVVADDTLYLTGKVIQVETNYKGNPRFVLENMKNFDGEEIKGKYKLTMTNKKNQVKMGECVELVASITPLPKPVMVGGYQMDRKLFFEGIDALGYVSSSALPLEYETPNSVGLKFQMLIQNLRAKIVAKINAVLPAEEAGITAAIVAGERGGINQKIIQNYRDSGLAHFLSISGLHMSMIAGIMFFLVRLLTAVIAPISKRYNSKKIAAVFAILMSAVYLLISGAEIPSQRAFIMTFVVLLGVLFNRQAISMRMIALAGLLVLIISPQALISASFQMSFAAVIVLIAFYEKYASSLYQFMHGSGDKDMALPVRIVKILLVYILGLIISDLVASVATLPFAIYHFNRIAIYTTLANALAGPIIGFVIMPFVLIALLLMPLGLDYIPLEIVGWGIKYVNEITAYVASMPSAGYQVMAMPFWGLMLIVFGGLWICIWNEKWRCWGLAAIIMGGLSIFMVKAPDIIVDKNEEVFAVKAENGDLLILPSRGNYYIKNVFLEKTANDKLTPKESKKLKEIYEGETVDKIWLDLKCDDKVCDYKGIAKIIKFGGIEINGQKFDVYGSDGASFYINKGKIKPITVREYIGNRFWNK